MRIVLVAADGETKAIAAEKLQDFMTFPPSGLYEIISSISEGRNLGFLADYRVELELAVARATRPPTNYTVFTDSLIDSIGYISLRLTDIVNNNPENDAEIVRWFNVLAIVSIMLEDGYKADHTLYIPYFGSDENRRDLDNALRGTLKEFEIPYREIDPDGEVDSWITN